MQVEGNDMTIQKLLITASALTLLAVGASAPAGARSIAGDPTPVTFLRSVQLPGQVLPAGDYLFERVNPLSSSVAVMVRNKRGTVQWMGLTNVTTRREAARSAIELSEARQGEAPRVLAWFPSGAVTGASFIY
jgi:hypothetical protein